MTDNIASSTTQQPQQNRMLIIHLGNDGVYFDTTVLLPSLITIPTQPQESLSYVQHKLSFPTLTMAVNHIVDEQKKSNGTSSSSYNTIHIILNLQELRTVWTNNMDLALLPLQSNNNNNNNTPHSMGNNSSSKLFVHTIQEQSADKNTKGDRSYTQMIHTSFLLAGLQCISEQKIECDTACSVPSSSGGVVIVRTMTAQKIVSSILSSSSASSSLLKAVPIPIQPAKVPTAAVTISLDDDVNNNIDSTISNQNDDLIDEDDLLQDEGLYNVAPPTMLSQLPVNGNNKDDCGGRTACDDCTCGRKEQEAGLNDTTNTASTTQKPVTSSACGKCGMGDAFRCASCPYLGKPAFKPGQEHLVLDLQDDL